MFDLISSEYHWTDDQILDLTLDRIAMCIRHIGYRLKSRERARIRLIEAATRYICTFAAQSQQAAEIASTLTLLSEDEPSIPQTPQPKRRVILPPGAQRELERGDKRQERFLEASVEDLPDVETRKVEPVSPSKMASTESVMALMTGQMGKGN